MNLPDLNKKKDKRMVLAKISTPTATALKLEVNIHDEQKAFEIIDAYLQSKDN